MKRLLKYSFTFLFAVVFALPALGQVELSDDNEEMEFPAAPLCNARIEFDHTVFDFGSITKGASVAHSYWFTNNGSDTLIITKIKPTCGCTVTKRGGITAAPGKRAYVDVIFNSGKFNGRVTKSINIETNDKLNPYLDIRFKSTINDPLLIFDYTPLQADFRDIAKGKGGDFKITLTNKDKTNSKIKIVDQPETGMIEVKLEKTELKPGESTTIQFTVSKDIPADSYLSSVTLEAEGKANSRFTIPISINGGEKTASK
jgi:hypothetical protein